MINKLDKSDEIVTDVKLNGGGVLHRVVNNGGVKMSTIWKDGVEWWSCYRGQEDKMVKTWNKEHEND